MLMNKPPASLVLSTYLSKLNEPPWTSFFLKYKAVKNDQFGMTSFNWRVNESNYHILRTGCYPYIKYHCTKSPVRDLRVEDRFFRVLKVINLGIPLLLYGVAATHMIRYQETITVDNYDAPITIYFLMAEHKGAQY